MKYPITHTMEQGTPEWDQIRLGKITASIASILTVKGKDRDDELGAGAITYCFEKATDILLGYSVKEFGGNDATENGHDLEPLARKEYEDQYFALVEEVGFVQKSKWIGCSPDGLIGKDGGFEAKCFRPDNHLKQVDLFDQFEKHNQMNALLLQIQVISFQ